MSRFLAGTAWSRVPPIILILGETFKLYRSVVIGKESPGPRHALTEEQRVELVSQQNEFAIRLKQLEDGRF